jgi:hypothetical protein
VTRPSRARCLALGVVVTALAVLAAAPGAAARGLTTGLIDEEVLSSSDATWFDRAAGTEAGLVRINVYWRNVVGSRRPVAPTNPADPSYDFGALDGAVSSAHSRGLDVLLTVLDAPGWATGKNRPNSVSPGAWKPDAKALGQFGQALATRYSGGFLGLPRVRYFEAWNEPNLTQYLAPQWKGKRAKGPDLYRNLLNSFYAGVHRGQGGARVVGGATGPFGDPRGHPLFKGQPRMRPLAFLRKLFCLKRNLKATKCHTKPHLDVLSHHPVNIINAPKRSARNPDDVEVADFHKIRQVLHAAQKHKTVQPGGNHPLWATEIWWLTDPPNRIGVPAKKAARWIEQSLYMLWKQGASAVVNYEIRDPSLPSGDPRSAVTTGLFFHNGKKKPGYGTFRFPFVTHRKSKHRVGIWGKAPATGKLQVQRKGKKGWKKVKAVHAKRGKIFQTKVRQRGGATFRAKVGKATSMPWHQGG